MRMYFTIFFCFVTGLLYSNVVFGEGVNNQEPPFTCRSLTASGNSEYPPFLWQKIPASTELNGVVQLIIEEIGRRIDIPIKLSYVGSWSHTQAEVKSGRTDLMAGAFYTNERAHDMDYFTPVMLHSTGVVWQRKDNPFPYYKKEDLEGKWGVTVLNLSFGQEFDYYAKSNLNILSVANVSHALEMLSEGRVDYMLYGKTPAQAYSTLLNLTDKIVPMFPHINSEGVYLTMSKKSPCNTALIKQKIVLALQGMNKDGFIGKAILDGVQYWQDYNRVKPLITEGEVK